MDAISKREVLPRWVRTVVIGRHPKWTIIRVAVLVVVVTLLYLFVVVPVRVHGISMEPTFHNGSINLINRLAYAWNPPNRGDVVCVRYIGNEMYLLKRIVGLPGETVAFSNGKLMINGVRVDEPYLKFTCTWDMAPRTLADGEYYIVGDNRSMDISSHTKGVYHIRDMIGRALYGGKATPSLSSN